MRATASLVVWVQFFYEKPRWSGAFCCIYIEPVLLRQDNVTGWANKPFFCFWRLGLAKLEDKLTDMLEPAVEASGFELVGVEFVRAGKHSILRVFIDHENGITVDDCADVSYQVSAILDVEDPISTEYNLEVSSPGLDRPLFREKHFQQAVGEVVQIRLVMPMDNRRNFKGQLTGCDNGTVSIDVDGQQFQLAVANIDKATVVPTFD